MVLYELLDNLTIYEKRKAFYTLHKETTEPVERWLHRVRHLSDRCQFGTSRDFVLIDKFVCELNGEDVERLRSIGELSLDGIFDAVVLNGLFQENTSESVRCGDESNVTECTSTLEELIGCNDGITGIEVVKIENLEDDDFQMNEDDGDFTYETKYSDDGQNLFGDEIEEEEEYEEVEDTKVFVDTIRPNDTENDDTLHLNHLTVQHLLQCELCEKQFVKQSQLQAHMFRTTHASHINSFTFECYLCGFQVDRLNGLKSHIIESHTQGVATAHKCHMCTKVFTKSRHLKAHLQIHQKQLEGHKCKRCGKVFYDELLLKRHLKEHKDKQMFTCRTCGRGYASQYTLRMRIHTGEKPYTCSFCPRTFRVKTQLNSHERIHRQDLRHPCALCVKRFNKPEQLRSHMRTHTRVRPFKCDVCGAAFNQPIHLKVHQQKVHTHNPAKPYKCTKCYRAYANLEKFEKHQRGSHLDTGPKPFDCKLCFRAFAHLKTLEAHQLEDHPVQ